MTTERGTPSQRRKRVRINDEATVIEPEKANDITPSIAARDLVNTEVASHPDPIQVFVKSIAKDYNSLKSKQRQQSLSIEKLKEDNFVPRSARVQFSLTAPTCVMEDDEFKKQKANVDKAIDAYKKAIKTSILETAHLVNKSMQSEIGKLLLKTVIDLSLLLILTITPNEKSPKNHRLAYYLVQHHFDNAVFDETWTNRPDILKQIANDGTTIEIMEVDDDAAAAPATQDTTVTWTINDATELAFYESLKDPFVHLINTIFVTSWRAQLVTYKKKAIDHALSTTTKRILGTDATNKATQHVDAEPSTGPKKIKELINQAVNSKTQKMQLELNRLSEKLQRSKNGNGGTKKNVKPKPKNHSSGAPSTNNNNDKKKGRSDENKKQSGRNGNNNNGKKQNGPSPAHNAADSPSAAKKKSTPRGRTSQRKNTNSRKRSSSRN